MARLKYVLKNPPENFKAMFRYNEAPRHYLHWNNDYTRARNEANHPTRTGKPAHKSIWHFRRPSGVLKWISNTRIDGRCQHPTIEAIDQWASCEIKRIQEASNQCPGHS